jgi:hypothetical protein
MRIALARLLLGPAGQSASSGGQGGLLLLDEPTNHLDRYTCHLCVTLSVMICLPVCLPACLPACLLACLPACWPACLPARPASFSQCAEGGLVEECSMQLCAQIRWQHCIVLYMVQQQAAQMVRQVW